MKTKIQLSFIGGADEKDAERIVQFKGRELIASVDAHVTGSVVLWSDNVVLSVYTAAAAALLGLPIESGQTHLILAMPPDCELARSLRDETKGRREI